jgi:hypothetical protein
MRNRSLRRQLQELDARRTPKGRSTMASTGETPPPYRELAQRANDGVEVVLFWHQVSNELTVSVSDQRTGAYFELEAESGHALDVFHHPYAYAAFRGLPYADVSRNGARPEDFEVQAATMP